ncbi:hypothetical protein, partial [Xanthomonas hortorum]|uniref:hypothetical protein n=1 Tax=Xanthomonas hortorum TaxID=56454 RepID=UPI001F3A1EDF
TDRLCRGGAPMQNLAHRASFHSMENNAPSKPGIKHPKRYPLTVWVSADLDAGDQMSVLFESLMR